MSTTLNRQTMYFYQNHNTPVQWLLSNRFTKNIISVHRAKAHLRLASVKSPLKAFCMLRAKTDLTELIPWLISVFSLLRANMAGSRGGGGGSGSGPPLKNHKFKGFPSNTGPDPLTNHKATKPAFNVSPSSARQQ